MKRQVDVKPSDAGTCAAVPAGVSFSEVMAGPFSLSSPGAPGGRVGDRTGRLVLRATLTIPDVTGFLSDPEHTGSLDAAIDLPEAHMHGVPASGAFNLFAPAPPLKLMIYRARFEHDGAAYVLRGVKEVGGGSVLHAWAETTTLRCRLHRGPDEDGPVCGRGTLRIGPGAFARQLLSFRGANGATALVSARALASFFLFFARELADSYLISG